jgi:uncharacterized protein YodC (DUF2158 family)
MKSGDRVQLKSGSIVMTVEEVSDGMAHCVWSIQGKVSRDSFIVDTLVVVN